jgi:hypothetical protein
LNGAEQHQRFHALRRTAQRRAEDENGDADKHQVAPAKKVRQFAKNRRGERRGEHIDRKDPAVEFQATELGDDGRHRRADDGRVDGEEKDHQHHAERGSVSPAPRQWSGSFGWVHVGERVVGFGLVTLPVGLVCAESQATGGKNAQRVDSGSASGLRKGTPSIEV